MNGGGTVASPVQTALSAMQQDYSKLTEVLYALSPWAIILTVMVFAMAIGVFALGKWRGHGGEDRLAPADQLTKFREMHERGEVSDEEFREIKTQLASRMQAGLNDSDRTG